MTLRKIGETKLTLKYCVNKRHKLLKPALRVEDLFGQMGTIEKEAPTCLMTSLAQSSVYMGRSF